MSRVTLKDVAAEAGVSYQTVSKVLNGQGQVAAQTEARIWQAVRDLNYQPNVAARNLRRQASNLIGYAWHSSARYAWYPVLDRFLHSITAAAEVHDYLITIFTSKGAGLYENLEPYSELYGRNQVDGFILAGILQDDPRVAFLMEQNIPFVSFGRANEEWEYSWVDIDGRYGIETAVRHLIVKGHQRIAFVGWDDTATTSILRKEGYHLSLQEAGIACDPDWIAYGPDSPTTGIQAMAQFMSLPAERRPTGIVCVCDQIAVGVIRAAQEAGLKIGTDIAITGYDDVPLSQFIWPALTTVHQPIYNAGHLAVDLLLRQIKGENMVPQSIVLQPELVVRSSS
jgi:DNA-binding LacI/PurR family transcriptional regulator